MPTTFKINVLFVGHTLEEIRLRSLQSILSKLELGLLHESELLHQDDIFSKLVKWFAFDTVPEQSKVLQLILRLIRVSKNDIQSEHYFYK